MSRKDDLIFAALLSRGHDPTDAGIDAHSIIRGCAELRRLERVRPASPADRSRIAGEKSRRARALVALAKPYGEFLADEKAILVGGEKVYVPI